MVKRTWVLALVAGLSGALAFRFLPAGAARVWGVVWPAAMTVVLGGAVRAQRPISALPWRLVVGGCAAFVATFATASLHAPGVLPNAFFLLAYVALVAAALVFARDLTGRRDPEGALDAAMVGCATAVALWQLVAQPALAHHRTADVLAAASFPVFSAFTAATAVRLAFTGSRRLAPIWLFVAAALADTISNAAAAAHGQTPLAPPVHSWVGVTWIANFALILAAALHPRMRDLGTPVSASSLDRAGGRLLVLGAALLVTPAILVVTAHGRLMSVLAAGGALGLVVLVMARLARLVRQLEAARADSERRAELQAAIVALGRTAIAESELEPVLHTAEALIHRHLGLSAAITAADRGHTPSPTELRFGSAEGYALTFTGAGPTGEEQQTFVEAITMVLDGAIERHRAEERTRYLALHDALTGLANRTLLTEQLAGASARLARSGGRLAVIFVDLDRFKTINDALGHRAGDELLILVAARLCGAVRAGDLVARLAGDEFVIACEDITDAEAAQIVARIGAAISEPMTIAAREVEVRASIGLAVTGAGFEVPAILARADEAMYAAKRAALASGGGE